MFPFLGGLMPSLISGGASLLGSIFSSNTSAQNTQMNIANQRGAQAESEAFNAQQAQYNREFQQQQALQQMNYQTDMSNTAFRRARQDMEAAGLNPMLAGISQSGASTPSGAAGSGSQASIGTPHMPESTRTSPFAGLGHAVDTAIQAAVSAKTIDKMSSEMSNMQMINKLLEEKINTQREETGLTGARKDIASAESVEKQIARRKAEGVLSLGDEALKAAGIVEAGAGTVSKVGNAIWDLVPSKYVTGKMMANGLKGQETGAVAAPVKVYKYGGPSARQAEKDFEAEFARRSKLYKGWNDDIEAALTK